MTLKDIKSVYSPVVVVVVVVVFACGFFYRINVLFESFNV